MQFKQHKEVKAPKLTASFLFKDAMPALIPNDKSFYGCIKKSPQSPHVILEIALN